MLLLLVAHVVAALAAPLIMKVLGRRGFLPLALVPAAAAVWAATHTSAVLAGDVPVERYAWVGGLSLDITFRLDVLSWLMTLIVGGVGAIVLAYCSGYFGKDAPSLGRFAGVFVAFAGAMLGLVSTDNSLALYVFWELTTVFSFLLIGHAYDGQPARRAAISAITVTTTGGLAMLAGIVTLGVLPGGSFSLSTLVASAARGQVGIGNPFLVATAVVLILAGVVTKSAQIPFHFWLPGAMAAPTPVSAYLHAAAMVKAGVYLVARLAPGFAALPVWQVVVLGGGLATMILGGYRALRQFDIKLILAFGTVSQLGFLIALVGYGDRAVMLAGLALLLAHATFKSSLFLVIGTVDHAAGTRDLRELSGLGRQMPVLATVAAVALASMSGLPPTLGYVGKEAALHALTHLGGWQAMAATAAIVVGSALTLAYGLRLWWGAFCRKPGVADTTVHRNAAVLIWPPLVLAAITLGLGLIPTQVEAALAGFANAVPGTAGHLVLWGGFGLPVVLTIGVICGGVALFAARSGVQRLQDSVKLAPSADGGYRLTLRGINVVAARVTAIYQRGSLPSYLATIFVTTIVVAWAGIALGRPALPATFRPWDSPAQLGLALVAGVAAILVTRARRRIKAVLLLGMVGYAVALLFAIHGAPDLAITQAVVETVSLVVFVLVMRRLPPYFSNRRRRTRWSRIMIAIAFGITTAVVGVLATGARNAPPVTIDYPVSVYNFGYGKNIVNVTLVDTRAWDTIGELSVLLAAATGVASLIFLRQSRKGTRATRLSAAEHDPRVWSTQLDLAAPLRTSHEHPNRLRAPGRGRTWLPGMLTLAPMRRSVIFEIGARMIFYPLLVFSLFLLFSGHNNPGGGFAGGMLAGIAFAVRYLAGGRYELAEAAPVNPGYLLGTGMIIATAAALVPVPLGGTILQTTVFDFSLPVFGAVHLATALFFDVGVYLIVIGLVLDVLRTLGGEIDRQRERASEQAPDIAHDAPGDADGELVPGEDTRSQAAVGAEAKGDGS